MKSRTFNYFEHRARARAGISRPIKLHRISRCYAFHRQKRPQFRRSRAVIYRPSFFLSLFFLFSFFSTRELRARFAVRVRRGWTPLAARNLKPTFRYVQEAGVWREHDQGLRARQCLDGQSAAGRVYTAGASQVHDASGLAERYPDVGGEIRSHSVAGQARGRLRRVHQQGEREKSSVLILGPWLMHRVSSCPADWRSHSPDVTTWFLFTRATSRARFTRTVKNCSDYTYYIYIYIYVWGIFARIIDYWTESTFNRGGWFFFEQKSRRSRNFTDYKRLRMKSFSCERAGVSVGM